MAKGISQSSSADDDFQPVSALNDLLFCDRRCALHRIEQVWVENRYTLEGTLAHQKVHAEPSRSELGAKGRLVRRMWLRSDRLELIGIADVVEFRPEPYPVEYKRGRRRRWDNDDVQLCAQGLCLEEMLDAEVPAGAIFHLKSRRRRKVIFDQPLRRRTEEAARCLHELVASGVTPPPVFKPRCRGCSLLELCMPTLIPDPRAASQPQAGRIQLYLGELYRPASEEAG